MLVACLVLKRRSKKIEHFKRLINNTRRFQRPDEAASQLVNKRSLKSWKCFIQHSCSELVIHWERLDLILETSRREAYQAWIGFSIVAMAEIIIPALIPFVAPIFVNYVTAKADFGKQKELPLAKLLGVLKDGLESLIALKTDNDKKLTPTIGKEATENYKLWKERVSKIQQKVASLDVRYNEEEREDGRRLVPGVQRQFCTDRLSLKDDIKEAIGVVTKLLGDQYPKEFLVDTLQKVIEETDVQPIEKYTSLLEAFEEINKDDLLKNDEVKCVALFGQKGAGKTTIMQHLNNYSVNKFDVVIFIRVTSREKTDIPILHKIANRMKVNREVVHRVLENKKFLLILDGIRHPLNGIWEKLNISKATSGSKVVITTQYPLALNRKYVDRIVQLKPLSPEDALKMFRLAIVGGTNLPDNRIIRQVCSKFCCCVPLLVNRIAKSFIHHEAPIDWNKAVNECTPWPRVAADQQSALNERMPQLQDDEEDLTELSSNLGICFRMLGEQSKKKCFLYASLYPANENIYTDYLVECCIVQGFFDDGAADTTYSEMRRTAIDVILRHLVNAAFLEEGEQMRYVKMNDLYRQFALYISSLSEDPNYSECRIYVDNEKHTEAFRSKSCENARWVSMIGSERVNLPTSQNFGSLHTVLLLQKNKKLVKIPDGYFGSMGNLLVLNLYGTEISKLPSLKGLTGLKAFYLNRCSNLAIHSDEIQLLKHLEVFDIRGIKVNFVPCFESLWCLRISYIPMDIYHGISKLHKLEELTIEGCNQMSNVDEAIYDTLLGNAACLSTNMEKLHLDDLKAEPINSKGRFSKLHTLILKNTSIVFKVAVDEFPELENLVVQNCSRIEVLIKVTVLEQSILPKLKVVKLDDLANIKSICSNENVAWSSLEKLHVRKCPELKALPFNTENATNLETIEGEEAWWNSLKESSPEVHKQFEFAFSAST